MADNRAKFTINGSAAEDPVTGDRLYVATHDEVLTLTLSSNPSDATSVMYEVYSSSEEGSPMASKNAPELVFSGSGLYKEVLKNPNGNAVLEMPSSGVVSYNIRCTAAFDTGQEVFERQVAIRSTHTPSLKKTVPAETNEALNRGFSDVIDDIIDALTGITPGGGVTSIAKEGESGLTGAVTLSEGTYVDLTQVGQDIEIDVDLTTLEGALSWPAHATSHQDGGSDEINVGGLSGVLGDAQNAGQLLGVDLDDTDLSDGDVYAYNSTSGNFEAVAQSGSSIVNLPAGEIAFGGGVTGLESEDALFWDKWTNFLGIGDSSPDCALNIKGNSSVLARAGIALYSSSPSAYPRLALRRSAHNTVGSHTAVTTSTYLGQIHFEGSDGVDFDTGAYLMAWPTENWTESVHGTKVTVSACQDGGVTPGVVASFFGGGDVAIARYLGIGHDSPENALDISGTDGTAARATVSLYSSSPSAYPRVSVRRSANNAIGGHTAVTTSTYLGQYYFEGSDGVDFDTGAYLMAWPTENWTESVHGTKVTVAACPDGGITPSTVATFWGGGNVSIDNRLCIGDDSPDFGLNIKHNGESNAGGSFELYSQYGGEMCGVYVGHSLTDTVGSHVAIGDDDNLGEFGFMGSNGTSFALPASIRAVSTQAFTGVANGAEMRFYVTPNDETASILAMTIKQNKDLALENDLYIGGGDLYSGSAGGSDLKIHASNLNYSSNNSNTLTSATANALLGNGLTVTGTYNLLACRNNSIGAGGTKSYSGVGGRYCDVDSEYSFAWGFYADCNADYSVAFGRKTAAEWPGSIVSGGDAIGGTNGDSQIIVASPLSARTTSTAATVMKFNTGDSDSPLVIPVGHAYCFWVNIIASTEGNGGIATRVFYVQCWNCSTYGVEVESWDMTGGESYSWFLPSVVVQGASPISSIAFSANDPDGTVDIIVTASTSNAVQWQANIYGGVKVETGYDEQPT